MISSTLCSANFRIVGNACTVLVKAIPTHHCAEHFYTNKQGFLRVRSKYLKYKPKGENPFLNNLWGVQWQQNSRGRKYLCTVSVHRAEEGPSFAWSWDTPRKSQQGDLKAQRDQVITQARKEIWQQRRKWAPTEPSVTMAKAKASPGSTRAKSKDWGRRANVSILGRTQDGRTVAKNNPTFSLALWIVLTQHHLVQLRIQTLDISLISTCLRSVVSREIEARK